MITGSIKGQKLSIIYPDVVSDSINYLTAKFLFRTKDWDGCVKTAYFTQGTTAKAVVLTNDQILESDGLNLSAGTWTVKLTGVRGTTRITTNAVDLRVVPFGTFSGDDLPDITPTEAEQILSMIGNLEDLSTSEKINLVAAINEIANRTGSGAVSSVNGKTGDVVLTGADIGFTDAGGYYTADTAEGALAEIGAQLDGLAAALEGLL